MELLYLAIGLITTTVGAISGIGGGVILKPVLDMFGHFDISTIGILSSCTVLAMSTVALTKKFIAKAKFEYNRLLPLSLGAVLGGFAGKYIFALCLQHASNEGMVKIAQSVVLALLMVFVLLFSVYKKKIKTFDVTSGIVCLAAGLGMGTISSFLGIGGGPINVPIIIILFSCNAKEAAIYSIFTIFLSQASTLGNTLFTVGFGAYDLSVVGYMIVGGISGGFLGDAINKKLDTHQVEKMFNLVMVVVILLNVYNVISVISKY
ncbi:MAG: hypothetical protein BEN18_01175 [Epulopiscium sp. Nuni2H_MBin001]|nr:MAG: hypothetical protein BEN18_01175 [Epulopiscium sp. Nuni2H_MBin001]